MKDLNTYIQEGLFDNIGVGVTEESIKAWIKDNCYNFDNLDLDIIQKDNKYIVNATEILVKPTATSLTNGQFEWGEIGEFSCRTNNNLISLEGSPEKCDDFDCARCNKLKTLKGAPKECTIFHCIDCNELKDLEGSPEKCRDFFCYDCLKLKSLKGAPQNISWFDCRDCLKLEDIDKIKVKRVLHCEHCPKIKEKYTEEQIKKITGANIVKL